MQVHSLPVLMAASQSVDMSLPMRQLLGFFCERAVAMSVWQRFRTRQVCLYLNSSSRVAMLTFNLDCPEREATYVITNGGINDPDSV